MKLDLTALRDSVAALEASLGYLHSDLASDPGLREQFRGACIQAFEFTYETAYKMIKRRIEQLLPDPGSADRMTYMEVIRTAAEAGLVPDVQRFRIYRDRRNLTSHTYSRATAESVVSVLDEFAADARELLSRLERTNEAD
jgi:nucleotidyltransferase substrate binding protein (TIGR01987 family)